MARQFDTEHEAKLAGYIEPEISEINGVKVTTIEKCLEKNSDGKYEWFSIVNTWTSSYWCTEDGEVLDEFEEDDWGWESNMPCDTYGPAACSSSCANYARCQGWEK